MNFSLRYALPLAAMLLPSALFAQDVSDQARADALKAHDGTEVLATVDGADITLADAAMMFESLPPEASNMPADRLMTGLVEQLISETALYQAALAAKLDENPEMKRRLIAVQRTALAEMYLTRQIEARVTDEAMMAMYKEAIADFEGQEEIRARHILVKTKEEAEEIIEALEDGTKFEILAADKSTGPSGPSGGDLGYFGKGQMVPAFQDVAFALEEAGDVSEPVETQFGWHVIKLEDRRTSAPPPFEDVADQIRQQESRVAAQEIISAAREEVDVSMSDEMPPAFLVREALMYQK